MPRAVLLAILLLLPTAARLGLNGASRPLASGTPTPAPCAPAPELCCPLCLIECPCAGDDPVPAPGGEREPYTPAPTDHLRAIENLAVRPVLLVLPDAPARLTARAARPAALSRLADTDPQSFLCVRTT
ncbi:MAG: hypothetical protein ACF8Q5_02510 [Phycisphaerales bacterium JB040]